MAMHYGVVACEEETPAEARRERSVRDRLEELEALRIQYASKMGVDPRMYKLTDIDRMEQSGQLQRCLDRPSGSLSKQLEATRPDPPVKTVAAPRRGAVLAAAAARRDQIYAAVRKVADSDGIYLTPAVLAEMDWENTTANALVVSKEMHNLRAVNPEAKKYRNGSGRGPRPTRAKSAPAATPARKPPEPPIIQEDLLSVGCSLRLARLAIAIDKVMTGQDPHAYEFAIVYLREKYSGETGV